ncbi:sensory neuron membrane protein 2 [Anticarsia gemmatalis]|uniref:sensory neuron membrane protein 2 n=1 Tax=Anticarsia gemmatalis TaxID=129554 RepID=UPI003F76499C
MCGIKCSVATLVIGALLVIISCIVSFVVIPIIVKNAIISEVVLEDGSIQLERFEEVPFPLNFTVRIFNLSNSAEVLTGAVPVMDEIGPYVYKLKQWREFEDVQEDVIKYRRVEHFEFDAEASYPNTEDDMVTIVNVPYHAIIQVAETFYPNLASLLNLAMNGIFGQNNSPIATYRVQDLLFNGVPICRNAGLLAGVACNIIRDIGANAQNLEEQPDGSLLFSVLDYKQDKPSKLYEVFRGINEPADLGRIIRFDNATYFDFWTNEMIQQEEEEVEQVSACNMINGTDAGIFAPFIDREDHLDAINTDICRSVELRYEAEAEYQGIPTARFTADEWLLDNDEGCFCLNVTTGVNREDGCLLKGAMELYTCVGAFLVMTYPHFLFADERYRDGVIGMEPVEEDHKIFIELEPNTGTPVRGAKRAQFNIFMRPVSGIPATSNLHTALVPFIWVEEAIALPDDFVDLLAGRLLRSLELIDILIPVLIAASAAVLVLGIGFTIRAKCRSPAQPVMTNGNRDIPASVDKTEVGGVDRTQ